MTGPTPLATYRVQLHPGFTFDDAAGVVDLLAALGATHLYTSPSLQATPGSTHGYDVVDPQQVNRELGGPAGHGRLRDSLADADLGMVLDIVPNHMAIGAENRWWWDVLENGPSSRYAAFFDVDWDPPESKLRNTVLLPVLGDHYGRVLEAGELLVERDGVTFVVRYHEHTFPLAPRSLEGLLVAAAARLGDGAPGADELAFIAASYGRLPLPTAVDRAAVQQRHRDKEVLRAQLGRLLDAHPTVAAAVDAVVAETNADADALDALLDEQNHRLAHWRTAGHELMYRRFFDINDLAALRVEDPEVFRATHGLVLGWLSEGAIDGVRVDHPDGLRDPEAYFRRLHEAAGGCWVVAEKILEVGERLPTSWLVAGTTGYDFQRVAGGLFVDPAGEPAITALWEELTGDDASWEDVAHDARVEVMLQVLAADLQRLADQLVTVCERHRRHRDHTRHALHEALVELIACFPVYRTYARPSEGRVGDEDVRHLDTAMTRARARRPDVDPQLWDFLTDLLALRIGGDAEAEFVARFQQVTGPVMAKGVEDTAFYRYTRFAALNEVGGDPSHFGHGVDTFHEHCAEVARRWPATMLSTSTHDTKRSEDVRARLFVLSEMADRWASAVRAWFERNAVHRGPDGPDPATELLAYQTMVGAHPLPEDRALAYLRKAAKEAKVHTSWTDPDPAYEAALEAFVRGVYADAGFRRSLDELAGSLVAPGRVTSLAQKLLALTAPGVPDVYQGTELWDLSLVDPDNRRPVDYDERRRFLAELDGLGPEELWRRADEGLPKLHLVRSALGLRRRRPEAFLPGSGYEPLEARGDRADHVVAFARTGPGGEPAGVTVAPRLVHQVGRSWHGTEVELPAGRWRDVLTGEHVDGGHVPVAGLLSRFGVALLESRPGAAA